ncbi:hypothetical protein BDZ94DRAFT_1270583 [Collybia nuda]|uniref:Uncharacterized protein n=1 Tax=Collybia nuda TaxID=64659 RepID=A0A9P5XWS8_9AGAR|nr:hypothetical protein BDZ94DRAFT_1270583 [Collybia nuda]
MVVPTLIRSHSWTSSVSLVSSSLSTQCTTSGSSSSTIPGPGAITGKAVKALGKATLRGFDRIIIARHLATITRIFPHTDEEGARIRNIEGIYDDLLEFSRPGMYSVEIRHKALGYILGQIGMNETRCLISALSRWHAAELHILLWKILIQITPLWNPSLKLVFSSPLFKSYTKTQPWSQVSLVPLILFFSKLIRSSHTICRVVLDVGFLDVLLAMAHTYNFDYYKHIWPASKPAPPHPHDQLFIASNAALLDITAYLEHRKLLSNHPIMTLWPERSATSTLRKPLFATRCRALLLGVEDDVFKDNDFSPYLDIFVDDDHSPYLNISLRTICSQPCVSTIPPEELLNSLTFEVTHGQALRVYLSWSPHRNKVALLSRLLGCMPISTPDVNGPDERDGFSGRYQLLFCLHFISVIAQTIRGGRRALLEADVVRYLVRILQTEIPDSYFARKTVLLDHSDVPRIIWENGLSYLVKDSDGPSTGLQLAIQEAFAALFPLFSSPNTSNSASGQKL